MPRWLTGVSFTAVFLLLTSVAFAQRDLGTVTGTIVDAQGAAVPNAKVTITNEATQVAYDTVTTAAGIFSRPAVNPGTYTVRVEAPGFQVAEQKGIVVDPGASVTANLTLQVGNASQTVEVTAAAPLLQTDSPAIGENLNSQEVTELPLGGQRVFTYLARLSPGVVPAEPGARDAANGGFSANGVRSTGENNFLLNGIDNNVNDIDFLNQTSFVIGPSVEAIGNMQVITNGASAEYGRAAGGVLDTTIKSGTNEVHGAIFEILQNTDLDANRWENNLAGEPRNKFIQNQFGAAVGAPIIRNKLFIFGDYQGTRIATAGGSIQNLGYGGFYTIPTAAEAGGNFSSLLGKQIGTTAGGQPILQNEIFDPTTTTCLSGCVGNTLTGASGANPVYTRKPYPGNIIPATAMDPASAKIAALFPAPNTSSSNCAVAGSGCYYTVTPGNLVQDQGDGRVDYHMNDKNSIFGSLSWSNRATSSVAPLPGALEEGSFYGTSEQDLGRNAMLSWTHIFSPTVVNEARVGFSRLVTLRVGANSTTDEFTAFGIGGYDPTTAAANNGGLPAISVGRYSSPIGGNDWLPTKEYNNEWDLIENLSVVKRKPFLKVRWRV